MTVPPRELPASLRELLLAAGAPPRLVAHLTLVHDVAQRLVDGMRKSHPDIVIDDELALFGAATHDIGKTAHPQELSGPGKQHEREGVVLLEGLGVEPHRARFAHTHGLPAEDSSLHAEDLLVQVADRVWKGKRDFDREKRLSELLAAPSGADPWSLLSSLDEILESLAGEGDARLGWQSKF